MSLVYNNNELIGKCGKYEIEKIPGTSPFVLLENFEPKHPTLNPNQKNWRNRLGTNLSWYGGNMQHALYATLQEPSLPMLTDKEFAQVMQVFSARVLEQEESDGNEISN